MNRAWRELRGELCVAGQRFRVGDDYFAALERIGGGTALEVARGLRAILAGEQRELGLEYRCEQDHLWRLTASQVDDPDLTGAVLMHVDMTEPSRAQAALRASEERLKAIIDHTPNVAIQAFDRTGRVQRWNHGAERMYGYSEREVIGRRLQDLILNADEAQRLHETIERIIRTGQPDGPAVWEVLSKDGQRRTSYSTMFAIPGANGDPELICMDVDITDRVRAEAETKRLAAERGTLEAQLLQAQKMEGIGRLAGGLAHDFNNLLTAIVGSAELTLEQLPVGSVSRENVEQILRATHRAAELTRQLLTFARKQASQPRLVRLDDLVSGTEKMLRRLIGEDVELVTQLDTAHSTVRADPGQLEQILVNLAVNARDAMPSGGRLTIETRDVMVDDAFAGAHPPLTAGRHVRLSVTDNGTGMGPEVLTHIFEPFFTTKEPGKGTGLGLATCYGITRQAGGHILARSAVGHGTTIEVYLPEVAGDAVDAEANASPLVSPRGSDTLLLVEDDALVRDLSIKVLESAGYRVLAAPDGASGLALAAAHQGKIDLLITDAVMPRLGGQRLAAELSRERPGIAVLMMSGYTESMLSARGEGWGPVALLAKPFTPKELLTRVRAILDMAQRR
ncbi:MAG: PAS domain S-box protein [Deltaproteobacteria bacterium]|nr:PAS domain S-box protein [Deltaproteobacteria bacterium]